MIPCVLFHVGTISWLYKRKAPCGYAAAGGFLKEVVLA